MSRTLEITVISGEGLRLDGRRLKKNAFAVVRTDYNNCKTTRMDADGGSHPSWNEKLVMDLPVQARFITVEVQCKASTGSNRSVGAAQIPVSDFIGGYTPESYLHFLSYRLREADGGRNGIINISVRVKVAEYAGSMPRRWPEISRCGKEASGPVMGIPLLYRYPV